MTRIGNRLLNGLAASAFAWALVACDDGLAGINENRNAPNDVGAELLLPQVIEVATNQILGAGLLNLEGMGLFAQHYAKIQYPNEDRYDLRPAAIENGWSALYAGPLKDAQVIIEKGEESGTPNHVAVGLILRSWMYGVMTDLWGDLPYSEALALDSEGTSTPRYDAQADIYAGLLSDLEQANDLIDPSDDGFGPTDLLYGGDMEAWRRFANSLRLRFAIRISGADPVVAQQHATAALAAGVLQSNDEMAQLRYAGSPPNEHPLFENRVRNNRDDHAISQTMVDQLLELSDPRLSVYAERNQAGDYAGMPNGMNDGHNVPLASVSRIGNYWRNTPNAPAVILSYAEVLFLAAEAARNGWGGDAASLYEAGVRASLSQYGISTAETDAYLSEPGVVYTEDDGRAADRHAEVDRALRERDRSVRGGTTHGSPAADAGPVRAECERGRDTRADPLPGGREHAQRR
jgi:hypothetical protein